MKDLISGLLSKSTDELSPVAWAFIITGIVITAVAFIVIIKKCFAIERETGRRAFFVLKGALIAAPMTVMTICSMLNINIPSKPIFIITVVIAVGIVIWNFLTFGPLAGILFSIVHIVLGLLAGIGIAAIIAMVVLGIIVFFFAGSSASSSDSSSSDGSIPSTVIGESNGNSYYVSTGANGMSYVHIAGSTYPIRQYDTGRYIDSAGNYYYSR